MASVLLLEPPGDVRELVLWTIQRLGHSVHVDVVDVSELSAVILEPAVATAVATTRALVTQRPGLPVICTSIEPPHPIPGLQPVAYLVKPFALASLEDVLESALSAAGETARADAIRFPRDG